MEGPEHVTDQVHFLSFPVYCQYDKQLLLMWKTSTEIVVSAKSKFSITLFFFYIYSSGKLTSVLFWYFFRNVPLNCLCLLRAVACTKGTLADTLGEVQIVQEIQSNRENQQQKAVEYQDLTEALSVTYTERTFSEMHWHRE